ncbi:MAG: GHMP family kinase ATP-binding protein [Terriglobales bacterium]
MHSLQGSSRIEPKTIVAQAPCRADLAGGTLDLWPLYLFHPGAVTVNFALTVYTTCRITPTPGKMIRLHSLDTRKEETYSNLDELLAAKAHKHELAAQLIKFFKPTGGFTLETDSQSPAGAGISGSSALMIATTAALAKFSGQKMSQEEMRVVSQNVEAQLINVPTGCQDYYPALYGGVSAVHLTPSGIQREAINVSLREIDERFLIVYTGAPRQSGINNWEVFKAHINGDKKVVKNFETISEIAQGMHQALKKADWDEVAHLLREEWKLRRSNHEGISTPLIDRLTAVAAKTGARAAKVCGAGGGGCVIFMVKDGARDRVVEALKINGGEVLPCRVSADGLTVKSQAVKAAAV